MGDLPGPGFHIHFIGDTGAEGEIEEDEMDDANLQEVAAFRQAMRIIDEEIDPLFEQRFNGPGPPPHAGGGFDLVFFIGSAALSGATWDLTKQLLSPLWRAMKAARDGDAWLQLDGESLIVLAMAEATRTVSTFSTDPTVIRCTEDFQSSGIPSSAGLFAFMLPDLHAEDTHVIVMDRKGRVLLHEVIPELSEDARCFRDEQNGWSWTAPEGGWSW